MQERRGRVFTSKILPPYLPKSRSLEEMLPWLHLEGVSLGHFSEALAALNGPDAQDLPAWTITRPKAVWEQGFDQWCHRSLRPGDGELSCARGETGAKRVIERAGMPPAKDALSMGMWKSRRAVA
ncbi:MAG: hypothetical protein CMJ58_25805 [Planctomycetaceae bacterium]|nr:hypothetical protein [Planctomycetaceae bacterium]